MTSASQIRFRDPQVEMAHGAGGIASRRLIDGLFAPILFGSSLPILWAMPRTSTSTARVSRSPPIASWSVRSAFPEAQSANSL